MANPNDVVQTLHRSFPPTAWTEIQAAKGEGDAARKALEYFCQAYWAPVYGYIARRTGGQERAKDLTQEFFLRSIKTGTVFEKADRNSGRFRTFLSQRLKWFLSEDIRKQKASKEFPVAGAYFPEPATDRDAGGEFDQAWAKHTVRLSLDRLEDRYREDGNQRRRQILALYRSGEGPAQIAAALKLNSDTAKNEIRAIVRDSHKCLWDIVRATVNNDVVANEEMEEIRRLLSAKQA